MTGTDSADTRQFAISPDGTRVAYDVTGSGPTVILLHGGGQTRLTWHGLGYIERLAQEFTVIAVDLRGNGDSDKPVNTAAFATDRVVEDVLAVADAAGAKTFALWGFSYGANVGRYTAIRSKRVTSMVYIGIPFGESAFGAFREIILGLRAKWAPIIDAATAGALDVSALSDEDRKGWESGAVPTRLAMLGAMLDYPAVEPEQMPCPTLWLAGTENKDTMASIASYKEKLVGSRVALAFMEGLTHQQELRQIDQTFPPALEFTRKHR